jgi:hypothetical protein
MKRNTSINKKYMTIAVSVVREWQSSASAIVLRGRTEARNSATEYISVLAKILNDKINI